MASIVRENESYTMPWDREHEDYHPVARNMALDMDAWVELGYVDPSLIRTRRQLEKLVRGFTEDE